MPGARGDDGHRLPLRPAEHRAAAGHAARHAGRRSAAPGGGRTSSARCTRRSTWPGCAPWSRHTSTPRRTPASCPRRSCAVDRARHHHRGQPRGQQRLRVCWRRLTCATRSSTTSPAALASGRFPTVTRVEPGGGPAATDGVLPRPAGRGARRTVDADPAVADRRVPRRRRGLAGVAQRTSRRPSSRAFAPGGGAGARPFDTRLPLETRVERRRRRVRVGDDRSRWICGCCSGASGSGSTRRHRGYRGVRCDATGSTRPIPSPPRTRRCAPTPRSGRRSRRSRGGAMDGDRAARAPRARRPSRLGRHRGCSTAQQPARRRRRGRFRRVVRAA